MRKCSSTTLEGSFSAVSKPIFAVNARFAALIEIYNICALLHRSKVNNFANNCNISRTFDTFCSIVTNIHYISQERDYFDIFNAIFLSNLFFHVYFMFLNSHSFSLDSILYQQVVSQIIVLS